MKKLWIVILTALFIGGLFGTANAAVNLVQNSSFENWNNDFTTPDFANWSEHQVHVATGPYPVAHTGTVAGVLKAGPTISDYGSLMSDKIYNIEAGLYEFGVWVNLYSDLNPTTLYNGDKAGITADVYWDGGGASYYYEATEFTSASGWGPGSAGWGYETGWFLISGLFTAVGTPDVELNISLQNWTNTVWRDTSVRVDDAYLQKVPEPSTLLLLGSGLVGLVGYRRRKRMM